MTYEQELARVRARVRARAKPAPRVRLIYQLPDGFEGWSTHATLAEARAAVPADAVDWVVIELPESGPYGSCGRVLASSED